MSHDVWLLLRCCFPTQQSAVWGLCLNTCTRGGSVRGLTWTQWSSLFLQIVFASPIWLHLQVIYFFQISCLPATRTVFCKVITPVSKSAPTLTGFCLPFRALHRNCTDGGSNDGSWHWWRCAGVLGHGPGSERCQSSLHMFSTLSSYIRLGKLDFYQWGSLAANSSSGWNDLYTSGGVWPLGNINI